MYFHPIYMMCMHACAHTHIYIFIIACAQAPGSPPSYPVAAGTHLFHVCGTQARRYLVLTQLWTPTVLHLPLLQWASLVVNL